MQIKTALVFTLVALTLSLTGCKKKATLEECRAEADRSVSFMKDDPAAKPDADYTSFHDMIVENCQASQTSAFAHCTIDAATSQDAVACQLKQR